MGMFSGQDRTKKLDCKSEIWWASKNLILSKV